MGIGNTIVAFKTNQLALLSNEYQKYYLPGQNEVKGERRPFLDGASIDLSSKLSLIYGSNVNHYESLHHPLSILPVAIGKLSFQISVQVYSLLSQTEGERKRLQKEGGIMTLPSTALGCYKR